jgi:hypothetical protein
MKTEKNETTNETAIITSGTVKEMIQSAATELGLSTGDNASCSAEAYGMLIFITLAKLGIMPDASLDAAIQAWNYIPKNPSAMRQELEKIGKEATSPAASALLAKYRAANAKG